MPLVISGVPVDVGAVLRGAAVAAVIVVPAAVVASVVDESSAWTVPAFLLAVAGFAVGGGLAGRPHPEAPAVHGALAAGLAVAVIVVISIVRRLLTDDPIGWLGLGATVLVAVWLGIVGGVVAARYLLGAGGDTGVDR